MIKLLTTYGEAANAQCVQLNTLLIVLQLVNDVFYLIDSAVFQCIEYCGTMMKWMWVHKKCMEKFGANTSWKASLLRTERRWEDNM